MERARVVEHPAVVDRLTRLRDAATDEALFRRLLEELGALLAYEATRHLPTREVLVSTPVGEASGARLAGRTVIAPIMRAGLGLVPGFLGLVESAVVAHLGFYRDPDTLAAVPYYANMPDDLAGAAVFVLDPMLATGHSGAAALDVLAARGARDVTFACILAAPEGVAHLAERHPTVRVLACGIDPGLNEHGYIVPGLGDAGDRMFGSVTSVPSLRGERLPSPKTG
jgi:uracil phosphoribosyltransferase